MPHAGVHEALTLIGIGDAAEHRDATARIQAEQRGSASMFLTPLRVGRAASQRPEDDVLAVDGPVGKYGGADLAAPSTRRLEQQRGAGSVPDTFNQRKVSGEKPVRRTSADSNGIKRGSDV